MFYTYILRSLSPPEQRYIGSTADLKSRLAKHNAGEVPLTSKVSLGLLEYGLFVALAWHWSKFQWYA